MKLTFNQWLLELKRQRVNKLLSIVKTDITKSCLELNNAFWDSKIKQCQPKEPYYVAELNGDTITYSFNPKYGN